MKKFPCHSTQFLPLQIFEIGDRSIGFEISIQERKIMKRHKRQSTMGEEHFWRDKLYNGVKIVPHNNVDKVAFSAIPLTVVGTPSNKEVYWGMGKIEITPGSSIEVLPGQIQIIPGRIELIISKQDVMNSDSSLHLNKDAVDIFLSSYPKGIIRILNVNFCSNWKKGDNYERWAGGGLVLNERGRSFLFIATTVDSGGELGKAYKRGFAFPRIGGPRPIAQDYIIPLDCWDVVTQELFSKAISDKAAYDRKEREKVEARKQVGIRRLQSKVAEDYTVKQYKE